MNNYESQGAAANRSGKEFENHIASLLDSLDIAYDTQVPYKNLYGSDMARMDFYIPSKHLYIECKNQNVSGSVDEKIPFCIENLLGQVGEGNSMLVLGGAHFATQRGQDVYSWANKRVENTSCSVVLEDEFVVSIQNL